MARLIDADALLDEFLKRYTERERNRNLVFAACEIKQDFADMISNFQPVDAVQLYGVRIAYIVMMTYAVYVVLAGLM